ncbi:uncharacterized protein LOC120338446 [Styela clava]
MAEAKQSQGCPLAMLAQTCSKIQPSESTEDQTPTKAKKIPIKIAPKFYALKNQSLVGCSPKIMVKLATTEAPNVSQSAHRPIFTVPLADIEKTQSISLHTVPNVVTNGNSSEQPALIEQARPPQIFQLVEPSSAVALIRSDPSQGPVILAPKMTATTVPTANTNYNPQLMSRNLKQISANTFIPSVRENTQLNIEDSTGPAQINICTQDNNGYGNANATIQIMMPPNTPLTSLQSILQLAANATKQYQSTGNDYQQGLNNTQDSGTAGSVMDDSNISDMIDFDSAEMSTPIPERPTIARKMRTQCSCANCINRRINPKSFTSKKRTHICSFENCNKEFGKTSHLRSHMRTHTGERPYACEIPFCNRKFTRSDELLRHHRTHSGLKKFECSYCDKRFTRSDHLKKHTKIHTR